MIHCHFHNLPAALLAIAIAPATQAGQFGVSPLRILLSTTSATASLTLENSGGEAMLVQSQVLGWSQRDGVDVFEETRNVLVSPPIFRVEAGAKQTLRIGLMHSPDPQRQLTYRIFLKEVPPPPKPGQQSAVSMTLEMSLPVFVAPLAMASSQLHWQASPALGGALALTLVNKGNVHAKLSELKLFLPDGTLLAELPSTGYILAGQSRTLTIKPNRPWSGGSLKLSAKTYEGMTLNAEVGNASGKP